MRLLRDREDWLLFALSLTSLVLAYLFVRVGAVVLDGELATVDIAVREWVLANRSAAGTAIFSALTLLGAKELLVPVGVLVGWRLFRGTRGWLVLLVFCAIASAEYVSLVKRAYRIPRPLGGIERSMGLSFPSGHSAGSAAVLVFLGYVAIRNGISPWIVAPIAAVIVLLVGVSRVYLDMHWTSDVIGGWIIGGAFGAGCCALFELIQRHSPPPRGATRAAS